MKNQIGKLFLLCRYTLTIIVLCTTINLSQTNSKTLLFRTETKIFHSYINNRDFEIYISFPVDYFQNDTIFYPALYCTDGNRNFNMLSDIVNILSFPGNEIPKILVVGIGYKMNGLEEWGAFRHNDLTPTKIPVADKRWRETLIRMSGRNDLIVESGGAFNFLEFISSELIPFIESNYRVNKNDRALFGYSLGGLFTLYTLFNKTDLFQRYYAGSPSISWDNDVILQHEIAFSKKEKYLPINLFISFGSLESKSSIEKMNQMVNRLNSYHFPNFSLETHVFEGETHTSCYPSGICRALKVVYK
jgi:predicted alpha/beta superfamily hydrolase